MLWRFTCDIVRYSLIRWRWSSDADGGHTNIIPVPGHSGITGNVIADSEAKEAAKEIVTRQLKEPATISIEDVRKLATEIAMRSWQRQWDEHSKGRKIRDDSKCWHKVCVANNKRHCNILL